MKSGYIELTILGIAQDGGVPQMGCSCHNCVAAHLDYKLQRNPVSCGVKGVDGTLHLIEVGRNIAHQLNSWSEMNKLDIIKIPNTVSITHTHLGHVDGIGQFGKEVANLKKIPFYASHSSISYLENKGLLSSFDINTVISAKKFEPSLDCGFELEFIMVPHRDENSDTHAIVVRGANKSLLFLPDHDDWHQTLQKNNCKTIKEWFKILKIDYALIDGTFWNEGELGGRDMSDIPHPTITETLEHLGRREEGDLEVYFFHLNHTNPVLNTSSKETAIVNSLGWKVLSEKQKFFL